MCQYVISKNAHAISDSKNMRDKLKNEEEERARKEREMADKMKEAAAASENEILTLHKRMAAENAKRIDEIEDLRYIIILHDQTPDCYITAVFYGSTP